MPRVNILKPSSKNENLIEICISQAKDALRRNNNYSWMPDALEDLKKFLNLNEINKIEAFDISHTSGKEVSASCVVMNKSGPDKKNYRIMNIRQDSNDDYLALSEAIKRRCKNLQKIKEVTSNNGKPNFSRIKWFRSNSKIMQSNNSWSNNWSSSRGDNSF